MLERVRVDHISPGANNYQHVWQHQLPNHYGFACDRHAEHPEHKKSRKLGKIVPKISTQIENHRVTGRYGENSDPERGRVIITYQFVIR